MSAEDGMLDIPEPEWTRVLVTDLATVAYRGRTVRLGPGAEVRFTGTHRGADEDGPYVVVHGTDSRGYAKQCTYRPGQSIGVRRAK